MKVKSDCVACLVERAKYECDIAFEKEEDKFFALCEFITFLAAHLTKKRRNRLIPEKNPVFFGTERERIIKRLSEKNDFHSSVKKRSNEVARSLIDVAEKFYAEATNKIEALIRIAAAANSMEYGIKGYSYDDNNFKADFLHTLNERLNCNMLLIVSAIERHKEILYITDNAGEIVFDAFVIKELEKMGKEVTVSPKKKPIINDATIEDVKEAGISSSGEKILPSGSCIGISLDEAEEKFLDALRDKKYMVIAKGMGNYEAIPEFEDELELKGRLIYVFRAKCKPVARDVGVKKGELVAKLTF